jgi:predicted nucleic acid-binding protein
MILDTQFIGALVDQDEDALEKARQIDARQVATRIPTAVIWEAYTGIGNVASDVKGRQLRGLYEQLVASHSTVDLTVEVARRAGRLNGEHTKSDVVTELDGADSIVAAHGLILDEPVVTRDSDFLDVDDLVVETY